MTDFVDPYLDPATGFLRNLVGARTRAVLDQAEADLVGARLLDLPAAKIPPTGDLTELRGIHRYLFQDVYGWAGQLRTVDIRKNVDGGGYFVPVSMIERSARFATEELGQDDYLRGMDRAVFIQRLAHHYDQLNYIHPFREGNGRAQRVFWDRVADDAGWRLNWVGVTGQANDAASRAAAERRDLIPLIEMFDRIVTPLGPA
ncbi:Fic/DOC family protein [Microbacterium ulmi]|uniref:Fic/DOC family protein n=1 Tax=Microbacterium ulmi TaxID=179095 RepID=UPI001ABB7702|nr:Fic family protein [Microbacterium ulmi]NII68368.1 cell filamentation protein [Microbacterium ulmi]